MKVMDLPVGSSMEPRCSLPPSTCSVCRGEFEAFGSIKPLIVAIRECKAADSKLEVRGGGGANQL